MIGNWTPCWGSGRRYIAEPRCHNEVLHNARAGRDIRQFVRDLKREAGEAAASSYLAALEHDLDTVIANRPKAFAWFREAGAPYRAKLFRLARVTYWIIYVVDDDLGCVEIVRFWNSAREPETHGL